MARLYLCLLGPPEVVWGGRPIALSAQRGRAILFRLAAEPDRRHARQDLAELLWPRASPSRRRNNLSVALTRLKAEMPLWPLGGDRDSLWWRDDARAETDAARFLRRLGPGRGAAGRPSSLASALDLWRGPFLEGLELAVPELEDWILALRRRWHREALRVAAELCREAALAGQWPRVRDAAGRALRIEPDDETFLRWAMRAHAALGEPRLALGRFAEAERRLRTELGLAPEPATVAVYRAIAAGEGASAHPRARGAQPASPLGLPRATGRERAREALLGWLAGCDAPFGPVRAVLVEGEAGIGKTHLLETILREIEAAGGPEPGAPIVLRARCHEEADDVAYGPLREALRPLVARIDPADPPIPAPALFELARLFPE
ncbi:MAG: AAA family ATPase, partial [Clostridia bacterium]|nr:AAA family ATPase [Clostridia bacterium]